MSDHDKPFPNWLAGGGELGELIRAKDWASTPLGAAQAWPQSLRSAVSILLPSRAQICLFWGPELVAIYNDAYRPALGIKHPWALGRPAREVWSEFWDDVLKPLLEGVLKTGEALWASDYPFMLERHGYPEETYFDISYDPVRDESGGVGGIFCIVSETTGRVVGERRLRLLRDLGRAASEARSVGEVFAKAAAVLEGNSYDLPFALLLDTEGKPLAGAHLDGPASCGWPVPGAQAGELILQGAALEPFGPLPGGPWPEAANTAAVLPIATPGHAPYAFLVAGVSPRRALDDAYRDFLRLVASNIGAGVAASRALEEQRTQAQALAELDRVKTAFFGNVSHEFRTPLTLLLGPLQDALAAAEISEAARPGLETARRNGMRLLKLVNTLLDFSRIEAGRAQARYAATDLAKYTAELASNFSSACEKAGLKLRVDCGMLREPVFVDRAMWEKIVLNLLSNAFKFTFEGEIEVTLAEAAAGVELRVRDTGIGIAPADLPRLFERFHRVEGARARTHEGSGIGLAFVRELARMHGGDIRVESEPGRGSTFTVRLPFGSAHLPQERLVAAHDDAPQSANAAAYVEEAMGWLRGLGEERVAGTVPPDPRTRILVVDDNADMREYIARLLGTRWSVTTAANGTRALALIAQHAFDLVISDVMMPQLDGLGLLERIKSQPATADLPVMLLSARAGEESRIGALAAGADDYIVKPFTAQQLLAQVGAQLAIRQTRRKGAEERERLLAREQAAKREAELQREHLYSLFMQAPNPIVILRGADYVIDLANPDALRVWGRQRDEVIGKPLFDALPELRGQVFKDLLDGVMRTGVAYEGKEVPAKFDRRHDGTLDTVYFNFVYTPLRGVAGGIEGILVTAFNVTDEVRAREEVDGLRAKAESASRAKDEFLAMLSHELRNPLAPILAAIQLIRLRGADLPELDMLERQTANLTRLVDDLLDVSRITRGKIELRKRPIEIREVLRRAMEMASPALEQRAHRVDLEAVPRLGLAVDADPGRMAQVIFNLLSNAAKYSDPGSLITVRAGSRAAVVWMEVEDRGAGIAPEMLDRVFDIFVQQQQTIARSEGGLGLGLTIVRSLVQLHGGSVFVHSAGLGHGSRFTIELPAARHQPAGQTLPAAGAQVVDRLAKRVLIVDDNVDAATSLAALLSMRGYVVHVAHDGPRALTDAQRFRPEIALIDIGLPVMDGYDLAQRLRQHWPSERALRLVAVTGYGLERDRARAAQAGFCAHLVKPIELARLDQLLAQRDADLTH